MPVAWIQNQVDGYATYVDLFDIQKDAKILELEKFMTAVEQNGNLQNEVKKVQLANLVSQAQQVKVSQKMDLDDYMGSKHKSMCGQLIEEFFKKQGSSDLVSRACH